MVVKHRSQIFTRLVNLDQDLFLIPNLAIHMDRKSGSGHEYNIQKDMLPLVGDGASRGRLMELVAEAVGVAAACSILKRNLILKYLLRKSVKTSKYNFKSTDNYAWRIEN